MLSNMPKNSFSEPDSTCKLNRKQYVREAITSDIVALSVALTREAPPLFPNSPLHSVFLKTFIVSWLAVAEEHDAMMSIIRVGNFSLSDMVWVPGYMHQHNPTWTLRILQVSDVCTQWFAMRHDPCSAIEVNIS